MGWLSDSEKERKIKTGRPVTKKEWDKWSWEEKKEWFSNVPRKKKDKEKDKDKSSWF